MGRYTHPWQDYIQNSFLAWLALEPMACIVDAGALNTIDISVLSSSGGHGGLFFDDGLLPHHRKNPHPPP